MICMGSTTATAFWEGLDIPVGLSFIYHGTCIHFNMAIVRNFMLFGYRTKAKERMGKGCIIPSSIMFISSSLVFYI